MQLIVWWSTSLPGSLKLYHRNKSVSHSQMIGLVKKVKSLSFISFGGKYSLSKLSMMEPLNESIQVPQKWKYPTDNADDVKKRNDARKEKRQTVEGKINISTIRRWETVNIHIV